MARWVAFVLALGLMGGAAWMAARHAGPDREVWTHVTQASPGLFVAAGGLILLTLAQTAWSFWLITRRYGPVGYLEMFHLISAAWLLNYLPLRPGMFGRLAWHRSVNGIPIRDSAVAMIWANVLSVLGAVGLAVTLFFVAGLLGRAPVVMAVCTGLPLPALAGVAVYARRRKPEPDPEVWRLVAGLASRYAELLIWAGRYWVCFQITGMPISWGAALAIAVATTISTMVPLFGNGLGIREWTVGLVATLLPAAFIATGADAGSGLAADLVNRAIEVLIAIPLGLASAGWLAARRRRLQSRARAMADETSGDPSPSA